MNLRITYMYGQVFASLDSQCRSWNRPAAVHSYVQGPATLPVTAGIRQRMSGSELKAQQAFASFSVCGFSFGVVPDFRYFEATAAIAWETCRHDVECGKHRNSCSQVSSRLFG